MWLGGSNITNYNLNKVSEENVTGDGNITK